MYQISDVTPVVLKPEDIKTEDLKCLPPGISDVPVIKHENLESLGCESFVEPQIKVEPVENSVEIKTEEANPMDSESTAAKGGSGKVKSESADEGDNTSNLVIESVTSLNTAVTTVGHLLMMKEDVLQTPTLVKTEVEEIPVKDEFPDSKSETAILPSVEINPHTIDESAAATSASRRPRRSCKLINYSEYNDVGREANDQILIPSPKKTGAKGEKPYSCTSCNYRSSVKAKLLQHIRVHTGKKPYSCTSCNYRSSEKGALLQHIRVHTGEKPYSCTSCDYRSSQKGQLLRHIRVHTGEKPYSCTSCDYRSSQKSQLLQHTRVHTGEKPYSCTSCDYQSSTKDKLLRHIRVHTGEKPYSCTSCNYRSSDKGALLRHIRVHTGEKPYSCTSCDYRSSQKSALLRHIRVHTGEKPYACPYCPYRALNSCTLKRHVVRIHNGIKKYKCEAEGCDYRASTSSRINAHMKTHMNERNRNKRIRISVVPQPPAITTTLTCYSCQFETPSRRKMKSHVLQHLVPVPPETNEVNMN